MTRTHEFASCIDQNHVFLLHEKHYIHKGFGLRSDLTTHRNLPSIELVVEERAIGPATQDRGIRQPVDTDTQRQELMAQVLSYRYPQ